MKVLASLLTPASSQFSTAVTIASRDLCASSRIRLHTDRPPRDYYAFIEDMVKVVVNSYSRLAVEITRRPGDSCPVYNDVFQQPVITTIPYFPELY